MLRENNRVGRHRGCPEQTLWALHEAWHRNSSVCITHCMWSVKIRTRDKGQKPARGCICAGVQVRCTRRIHTSYAHISQGQRRLRRASWTKLTREVTSEKQGETCQFLTWHFTWRTSSPKKRNALCPLLPSGPTVISIFGDQQQPTQKNSSTWALNGRRKQNQAILSIYWF